LNRAAAFDRANGKARRVAEAAHYARLPLQRAGDCLVDLGRVLQVDHMDVALRRGDDEQLVLDVHAVHALFCIQGTNGFRALQIPELDRLIPGPGCNVVGAAGLEPAHAFDALGMCLGLLGRNLAAGGGGAEVDDVEMARGIASG
jgi:hypothetical protein